MRLSVIRRAFPGRRSNKSVSDGGKEMKKVRTVTTEEDSVAQQQQQQKKQKHEKQQQLDKNECGPEISTAAIDLLSDPPQAAAATATTSATANEPTQQHKKKKDKAKEEKSKQKNKKKTKHSEKSSHHKSRRNIPIIERIPTVHSYESNDSEHWVDEERSKASRYSVGPWSSIDDDDDDEDRDAKDDGDDDRYSQYDEKMLDQDRLWMVTSDDSCPAQWRSWSDDEGERMPSPKRPMAAAAAAATAAAAAARTTPTKLVVDEKDLRDKPPETTAEEAVRSAEKKKNKKKKKSKKKSKKASSSSPVSKKKKSKETLKLQQQQQEREQQANDKVKKKKEKQDNSIVILDDAILEKEKPKKKKVIQCPNTPPPLAPTATTTTKASKGKDKLPTQSIILGTEQDDKKLKRKSKKDKKKKQKAKSTETQQEQQESKDIVQTSKDSNNDKSKKTKKHTKRLFAGEIAKASLQQGSVNKETKEVERKTPKKAEKRVKKSETPASSHTESAIHKKTSSTMPDNDDNEKTTPKVENHQDREKLRERLREMESELDKEDTVMAEKKKQHQLRRSDTPMELDEYSQPFEMSDKPPLVQCLHFYSCGAAANTAEQVLEWPSKVCSAPFLYGQDQNDEVMAQRSIDNEFFPSSPGPKVEVVLDETKPWEGRGHIETKKGSAASDLSVSSLEEAPALSTPRSLVTEVTGKKLHLDDDTMTTVASAKRHRRGKSDDVFSITSCEIPTIDPAALSNSIADGIERARKEWDEVNSTEQKQKNDQHPVKGTTGIRGLRARFSKKRLLSAKNVDPADLPDESRDKNLDTTKSDEKSSSTKIRRARRMFGRLRKHKLSHF